jgi:glutaredoxin 3
MNYAFKIYTKQNCSDCTTAKRIMQSKGIAFEEVSLDDEQERQNFYTTHVGVRSMPQVFINDQRVGGVTGLQQALNQLGL